MNTRVWVPAVALPLAAIVVVVLAPQPGEAPVEPQTGIPEIDILSPSFQNERPELPEIEFDRLPPGQVDFETAEMRDFLSDLNRSLRISLDDRIRNERMAALDAGFGGEENIVLPALPGISGFEVAICPASRNCLNARLLEQADDPSWARPMEAGIFGELSRLPGGVGQAHVVCRQTICGILLPLSPGAIRPDRTPFIGRLQTEFGFSPYYNTADSADLQAIYLTTVLPSWWPVTESDD